MTQADYINKWLRQFARKTDLQIQPKRTLYRPLQWGEHRLGYLKTRYETSLDMIAKQIAWVIGKRVDLQIVYDTLIARGHQFVQIDTQLVCVTIAFERKGV